MTIKISFNVPASAIISFEVEAEEWGNLDGDGKRALVRHHAGKVAFVNLEDSIGDTTVNASIDMPKHLIDYEEEDYDAIERSIREGID